MQIKEKKKKSVWLQQPCSHVAESSFDDNTDLAVKAVNQILFMNAFKSVVFFQQCGTCFSVVCVRQREFSISWVITH